MVVVQLVQCRLRIGRNLSSIPELKHCRIELTAIMSFIHDGFGIGLFPISYLHLLAKIDPDEELLPYEDYIQTTYRGRWYFYDRNNRVGVERFLREHG